VRRAEFSVTEIGRAMSEIAYIVEEMKNMLDEDAYTDASKESIEEYDTAGSVRLGGRGYNKPNVQVGCNIPATAEELSELMSKFGLYFIVTLFIKKSLVIILHKKAKKIGCVIKNRLKNECLKLN